jgi:hypothetical protein
MLHNLRHRLAISYLASLLLLPVVAAAQVTLYDIEADPEGWRRAVVHTHVIARWDLDNLPDFGVSSVSGPLTSTGSGPIPAGFLPSIVTLTSSGFRGTTSLAFVGASTYGVNNPQNAMMPNQPQESFDIFFGNAVRGFSWDAFSCSRCVASLGVIEITVVDDQGMATVFKNVSAPDTGHIYGLLAEKKRGIVSINFHYPGVVSGLPGSDNHSPGFQGAASIYGNAKTTR